MTQVLLLHLNGSDGSTSIKDSSPSAHTVSALNGAEIDTAQSKFGGSSGFFPGSDDRLSITDNLTDFDYGSSTDFEIDLWVRFSSVTGSEKFFFAPHTDSGGGAKYMDAFFKPSTSEILFRDNGVGISASWSPSADTQYHLTFNRIGSTGRIFIDGTQVASGSMSGLMGVIDGLNIGNARNTINLFVDGHIDEFQVQKAGSPHSTNFTPETAEYEPSLITSASFSGIATFGAQIGLTVSSQATFDAFAVILSNSQIVLEESASFSGTAIISPTSSEIVLSSGNVEVNATATFEATIQMEFQAEPDVTGLATFEASPQTLVSGEATFSATATFDSGSPLIVVLTTAEFDGTAVIATTTKLDTKNIVGVEGNAFVNSYAITSVELIIPVNTGDIIELSDPAKFQLVVNGEVVDLTSSNRFNMNRLNISYNGKEVTFTEAPTPALGNRTYSPEHTVKVNMDFGSGLTTYFDGRIKDIRVNGVTQKDRIQYTAIGKQRLANDVTLVNTDGLPEVNFTIITTVLTTTSTLIQLTQNTITSGNIGVITNYFESRTIDITTTYTKDIGQVVADLFSISATALGSAGIPATIGSPGLENLTGELAESVTFRNSGFFSALDEIVSFVPGRRPMFDAPTGTWIFPNIMESKVRRVQINSMHILNLLYQTSTRDRYSAIRLIESENQEITDSVRDNSRTISVSGEAVEAKPTILRLDPDWDPDLQDDWTILKGDAVQKDSVDVSIQAGLAVLNGEVFEKGPQEEFPPHYFVFRQYKMPKIIPEDFREDYPPIVWQLTDVFQEPKEIDGVPEFTLDWVPVEADIDPDTGKVITREPIVRRGNVLIPGDARPPNQVVMTYWGKNSFTHELSLGNTISEVSSTANQIRCPEVGFEGSAFRMFGLEREKVELVSKTEVTTENACTRLSALKDLIITGDLPIGGDPVEDLLTLQARVLTRHNTISTGFEDIQALLTEYEYEFGRRGTSRLVLTTDISGLIKAR